MFRSVFSSLPMYPPLPLCKMGSNELKSTGATVRGRGGGETHAGEALFFISTQTATDSVSPHVQVSTSRAKNRGNVLHQQTPGVFFVPAHPFSCVCLIPGSS